MLNKLGIIITTGARTRDGLIANYPVAVHSAQAGVELLECILTL